MHLCMIRVIANTSIDGGLEKQQEVEHVVPKGAREEREACSRGKDEGKDAREEEEQNRHPGRPMPGAMPTALPNQPASRPTEAGCHAGHPSEPTSILAGLCRLPCRFGPARPDLEPNRF